MNQTRYNPNVTARWSGDDGDGSGDGDDGDLDEVQLDGGDDGDDFPLREGISLADFCLPESFSLSVVFRFAAAAEYFSGVSPVLRIVEGRYMRRDAVRCGPGPPHHAQARPRAGPRLGVVWAHLGSVSTPLLASSVIW